MVITTARRDLIRPSRQNGFAQLASQSTRPQDGPGLIGFWPPELGPRGGLTLRDVSRSKQDGILTSMDPATDWIIDGEMGSVLDFDGIDGFVNLGDSDGLDLLGNFTVMLLIRPDALTDDQRLFDKGGGGGGTPVTSGWTLQISQTNVDSVAWRVNDDSDVVSNANVLSIAVWAHVAVTYDGVTLSFFIDGFPQGSGAINQPIAGSQDLHIGTKTTTGPNAYNGRVANPRIYDRLLTPTHILGIAQNTLGSLRQKRREAAPVGQAVVADQEVLHWSKLANRSLLRGHLAR